MLWDAGGDQRRLVLACGFSLLLHGLVLMFPAGGLNADGLALPPAPRLLVEQLTVSIAQPLAQGDSKTVAAPAKPMSSGAMMVSGVYELSERSRAGAPEPQAGPEVPLFKLPDLEYRPARDLTRRPHPLNKIVLETQEIRFRKETGSLILVLRISQHGIVDSIDVERSNLPPLYAQTARKAFAETSFQPGELNGKPVKSLMRIEVTYVPLLVPVMFDLDIDRELQH